MTPTRTVILIVVGFSLLGCRDSNPSAIAPKNPVANRSRIQGLNARVRNAPEGTRFAPTNFDVAPANMNWTQFRGKHGRSVAERDDLAKHWSEEKGIYWKTELPGRGASSPIILFKHVYVTAASGYGESPDDLGSVQKLRHHLICLDRQTGDYLWQRDIQGSPLTQELTPEVISRGFASSTPVSDGQMVYAFFGASGVFAFDREGELVWQADVGFQSSEFGSGASLTLYNDLLIVNASIENQTVYALNKKTGEGAWKIDGIDRSLSTPVFDKVPKGSDELIILEEDFVRGFDPKTGNELWYCDGIHDVVFSTPFVQNGVCFCNGGIQKKQLMAIKLGGRGDVTKTHKLWEAPSGAVVNSPIYLTGYVFLLSDEGVFQCFDARNGELVTSSRMPTKSQTYASPLLSANTFYVPLEDNGVVVCEANSQLSQISHNTFENDPHSMKASLAVSEQALFLRNDGNLYRISERDDSGAFVSLSNFTNESELIIPSTRYDFDSSAGRLRAYNQFLSEDKAQARAAILIPFESELTDEQTTRAHEVIDQELEKFVEFRQQQRAALWKLLKSSPRNQDAFNSDLENLDQKVTAKANEVRKLIEELLADDQQDQDSKKDNEQPKTVVPG